MRALTAAESGVHGFVYFKDAVSFERALTTDLRLFGIDIVVRTSASAVLPADVPMRDRCTCGRKG